MAKTARRQSLEKTIFQAFGNVPYPNDNSIARPDDPQIEQDEIKRLFRGKRWQDLSNDFLMYNHGALYHLSEKALIYFLPAFLMASLDYDQAGIIGIFTVNFLFPSQYGSVKPPTKLFSNLNDAQRDALREFANYLRDENVQLNIPKYL